MRKEKWSPFADDEFVPSSLISNAAICLICDIFVMLNAVRRRVKSMQSLNIAFMPILTIKEIMIISNESHKRLASERSFRYSPPLTHHSLAD